MKKISLFLVILTLLTLCSCSKEELSPLSGSIWVHIYKPEDNMVGDIGGNILFFGEKNIEYFILDKNHKLSTFSESFDYKVKDGLILAGDGNAKIIYGDNYLFFDNKTYYRTSQKREEFLP